MSVVQLDRISLFRELYGRDLVLMNLIVELCAAQRFISCCDIDTGRTIWVSAHEARLRQAPAHTTSRAARPRPRCRIPPATLCRGRLYGLSVRLRLPPTPPRLRSDNAATFAYSNTTLSRTDSHRADKVVSRTRSCRATARHEVVGIAPR